MPACQICLFKIDQWLPTVRRLEALPDSPAKRRVLRRTNEAIAFWRERSTQTHKHSTGSLQQMGESLDGLD